MNIFRKEFEILCSRLLRAACHLMVPVEMACSFIWSSLPKAAWVLIWILSMAGITVLSLFHYPDPLGWKAYPLIAFIVLAIISCRRLAC